MFNINDKVYVFLYDLNKTLIKQETLNANRFGVIKEIIKVELPNNKIGFEYIVDFDDNKTMSIKNYDSIFNLYTIEQLIMAINNNDVIDEDKREKLLLQIEDRLVTI